MNEPFRELLWDQTRIQSNLDFTSPGKRFGDLRLKYSDNETALGFVPIPAGVIINGVGPTILLTGGVHGDEFEGPVSLIKFLHDTRVDDVQGRIIVFPVLNSPAVHASSRVSPLDEGNLNRAFPGHPNGTPTEVIANFIDKAVMPICDAVIDIHSGGKAAWFSPCAMATYHDKAELLHKNIELATVFDCPIVWLMNKLNDNRSVNSAAAQNDLIVIAAELGGGGQVTPETLKFGERGIRNCLRHLKVLSGKVQPRTKPAKYLTIVDEGQFIFSTHRGLFEPTFSPGDTVSTGDPVGYVHNIDQIELPPVRINFPTNGVAFVRCHRGLVERGELLALVGVESESNTQSNLLSISVAELL